MSTKLKIPTVHLNGTSPDELLDGVTDAANAIRNAITKLRKAWPNGRDYYVLGSIPQDGHAVNEAQKEWEARSDKLSEVLGDMNQIAEGIWKQIEKRQDVDKD